MPALTGAFVQEEAISISQDPANNLDRSNSIDTACAISVGHRAWSAELHRAHSVVLPQIYVYECVSHTHSVCQYKLVVL